MMFGSKLYDSCLQVCRTVKPNGVEAVSYTHLDVYKRQTVQTAD